MKKAAKKIVFIILLSVTVLAICTNVFATETKILNEVSNRNKTDLLKEYDDFTSKYSNEDIIKLIEDNKEQIKNNLGVDESTIDFTTNMLVSLDRQEIRQIIENDINVEEIQRKIDEGYTSEQILNDIQKEMSSSQKASILIKTLIASYIVKRMLIITILLLIYKIVLRWIIYKKAKKHGWAAIIPIYNDIVYLKVCNINSWWILTAFIPVIGWIIYGVLKIVSRFKLAKSFDRGVGFGFGLLLLPVIFESIIAFNSNIKYTDNK